MSPPTPNERRRATSRKGWFAQGRLPVAAGYVALHRRRRVLWCGLVLVAAFLLVVAFDLWRDGPQMLAGGPISSAHASFAGDCSSCHAPMEGAVGERCIGCHTSDVDAAGNVVRAQLADRSEPSELSELSGAEQSHYGLSRHSTRFGAAPSALGSGPDCAACHLEHLGRGHSPSQVADGTCRSCHEMTGFERAHPEFDAVAAEVPAPGASPLAFTHVFHVAELMKADSPLQRRTAAQGGALATCAYCHEPEGRGESFAALSFDQHCAACHLNGTQSTAWLPVVGTASEGEDGSEGFAVRLLDGSDGERRWGNPADLNERRGRVRKTGVRHADPWILENLRRLRGEVFEPAPLADLLVAAPQEARETPVLLYRQAIAELEARIDGLERESDRSTRSELASLRRLLENARTRLAQSELSAEAFAVELRPMPLTSARQAELEEVTAGLAGNCTGCHTLERLTVVQAPTDLAVLHRARFDHAAHRLQLGCLDCHDRIPELAALQRGETVDAELAAAASDRAETVNLPGVEQCASCHRAEEAAASCTTCHDYHPGGDATALFAATRVAHSAERVPGSSP